MWARCVLWELTPRCARGLATLPRRSLRTLDALHLATFALAREKIAGLELVTVDVRSRGAWSGLKVPLSLNANMAPSAPAAEVNAVEPVPE